ncbi:MAG: glycosyltransferase family 4 protein [Anaerolineae bacterium]|nr:glycosyltransferase family 4 protein [Anaerolineae bacterium]
MARSLPQVGFLTGDIGQRHGWARYSHDLLLALQRAGLPFTVVSARNSPPNEFLEQRRLLPGIVPAERQTLARSLLASPAVARALRDCDLLHSLIEPCAVCGLQVAGRRPHLVTAHGSYLRLLTQRRWPAGALWRRSLARSQLVCVSRYTARVAQDLLPGAQPLVIPNGIDASRFERPVTPRPVGGPTVLSVGAPKARKGTLELLRAMARVTADLPQARCVIVGNLRDSPVYVERLRAEIHRLDLEQRVTLTGQVDEPTLLAWYAAAQVFALPSLNIGPRFEGFGLAHLEAGAAGLPVIGTRDCGAEDAIVEGETGLLLPQQNVEEALAEAITGLLRDPRRAQRMGAAGRARALRQTWARVADELIAHYRRLAAR